MSNYHNDDAAFRGSVMVAATLMKTYAKVASIPPKETTVLTELEVGNLMTMKLPITITTGDALSARWKDPCDSTRVVDESTATTLAGMGLPVWCFATRVGDWFFHTSEEGFEAFVTWDECRPQKVSLDRVYTGHTSLDVSWMLGMNIPRLGEQLKVGRLPSGSSGRAVILGG